MSCTCKHIPVPKGNKERKRPALTSTLKRGYDDSAPGLRARMLSLWGPSVLALGLSPEGTRESGPRALGCFAAQIQLHPTAEQQFRTANPTSHQWSHPPALQKAAPVLKLPVPGFPHCSWPCAPGTQGSAKRTSFCPWPYPTATRSKGAFEGHRFDKGWEGRVSKEPVRRACRGCHL